VRRSRGIKINREVQTSPKEPAKAVDPGKDSSEDDEGDGEDDSDVDDNQDDDMDGDEVMR
jgi:hypothetical protein